ncbi:MAG: hypothetical protein AB1476_00290 [Candidatus Hadarchaeota archaeon]
MAGSKSNGRLSGARKAVERRLFQGVGRWVLEFLLTLGILYFVFAGALILIFRTDSYWMAVTSGSMVHEGQDWESYFEDVNVRKSFLVNQGLTQVAENTPTFDASKFPIQGGFERGDLLFIQGVGSVSDISVGDVLIVDRSPYTIPLTHRVLAVWEDSGAVRFTTKGDHNTYLVNDSNTPWPDDLIIYPERITGKVVFVIPKLGNIALWFQNR